MADTFDQFIFEFESGSLNAEMTQEMNALSEALQKRAAETGKAKGKITIKLSFEAQNNGRVESLADAKVETPGPRKAREIRWIDKRGRLAAEDPRQTVLPMSTRRKEPVT